MQGYLADPIPSCGRYRDKYVICNRDGQPTCASSSNRQARGFVAVVIVRAQLDLKRLHPGNACTTLHPEVPTRRVINRRRRSAAVPVAEHIQAW